MPAVRIESRDTLASFFGRNPIGHAYELGDLDDLHWPHTTWFALGASDDPVEIALVYDEPSPPVLVALASGGRMAELLGVLRGTLPDRVYAHVAPDDLSALLDRFDAESHGLHLRMGLTRTDLLERYDDARCERLTTDDLHSLEELYAAAYPGTWFTPHMLEAGPYVGLREDGRLVAVAGVHVHSPRFGVAALGNVATLPAARGLGLGGAVCARLCREILADGVTAIALNVHAGNAPAIRVYERLGFTTERTFEEVMLTARRPSR